MKTPGVSRAVWREDPDAADGTPNMRGIGLELDPPVLAWACRPAIRSSPRTVWDTCEYRSPGEFKVSAAPLRVEAAVGLRRA